MENMEKSIEILKIYKKILEHLKTLEESTESNNYLGYRIFKNSNINDEYFSKEFRDLMRDRKIVIKSKIILENIFLLAYILDALIFTNLPNFDNYLNKNFIERYRMYRYRENNNTIIDENEAIEDMKSKDALFWLDKTNSIQKHQRLGTQNTFILAFNENGPQITNNINNYVLDFTNYEIDAYVCMNNNFYQRYEIHDRNTGEKKIMLIPLIKRRKTESEFWFYHLKDSKFMFENDLRVFTIDDMLNQVNSILSTFEILMEKKETLHELEIETKKPAILQKYLEQGFTEEEVFNFIGLDNVEFK